MGSQKSGRGIKKREKNGLGLAETVLTFGPLLALSVAKAICSNIRNGVNTRGKVQDRAAN